MAGQRASEWRRSVSSHKHRLTQSTDVPDHRLQQPRHVIGGYLRPGASFDPLTLGSSGRRLQLQWGDAPELDADTGSTLTVPHYGAGGANWPNYKLDVVDTGLMRTQSVGLSASSASAANALSPPAQYGAGWHRPTAYSESSNPERHEPLPRQPAYTVGAASDARYSDYDNAFAYGHGCYTPPDRLPNAQWAGAHGYNGSSSARYAQPMPNEIVGNPAARPPDSLLGGRPMGDVKPVGGMDASGSVPNLALLAGLINEGRSAYHRDKTEFIRWLEDVKPATGGQPPVRKYTYDSSYNARIMEGFHHNEMAVPRSTGHSPHDTIAALAGSSSSSMRSSFDKNSMPPAAGLDALPAAVVAQRKSPATVMQQQMQATVMQQQMQPGAGGGMAGLVPKHLQAARMDAERRRQSEVNRLAKRYVSSTNDTQLLKFLKKRSTSGAPNSAPARQQQHGSSRRCSIAK